MTAYNKFKKKDEEEIEPELDPTELDPTETDPTVPEPKKESLIIKIIIFILNLFKTLFNKKE